MISVRGKATSILTIIILGASGKVVVYGQRGFNSKSKTIHFT